MTANCMLAIAAPGRRACATTTIRWKLSAKADPFVRETAQQVDLWLELWRSQQNKDINANLKRSWNEALRRMYFPKVDWRKVSGPISATIAALARAKWKPSMPNLWFNQYGDQCINIDEAPYAKIMVRRALEDDLEGIAWQNASQHYLGQGLDKGIPDLDPARRVRSKMVKMGLTKAAAALDAVVCGACWHHDREGLDRQCFWCGQPDTPITGIGHVVGSSTIRTKRSKRRTTTLPKCSRTSAGRSACECVRFNL